MRGTRNREGRPWVHEEPDHLERQLVWYVVDYTLLGRSYWQIARKHKVAYNTVWQAIHRIRAFLPNIKEHIPA